MTFPEFGVKKPVTNLMIFSAIIILALYSLSRLGIDMMPEIEPPSITVISTYPGAGPEDVEVNVTEELENQLGTTPGLEKITSNSSDGSSIITLKFVWGTNLDEASNDVRDRIELAKRFLPDIPDEMENPFIFKFNTANIPIIYFGITAQQTYANLYDLVDKNMLIRHDFNLNGTINRALELNATKSIKIILEYIIEHGNSSIYNKFILLDIIPIIQRRNFEINLFFSRSEMETALNKNESKSNDIKSAKVRIQDNRLGNEYSKEGLKTENRVVIKKANLLEIDGNFDLITFHHSFEHILPILQMI